MESLKEVLMRRDEMTSEEADEVIDEMVRQIEEEDADPEEVLLSEVGLEPDYVFDLLDRMRTRIV